MNDLVKLATTMAAVAGGVILAGVILDSFGHFPVLDRAKSGLS